MPITHRTPSISQLSTAREVSISNPNALVLLMPCLAADCMGLVFSEAGLQDQMDAAPKVRCRAYHVKVVDCIGLARKFGSSPKIVWKNTNECFDQPNTFCHNT